MSASTWMARWTEATRWWLEPTGSRPSPERLLFDIVEGISGRFRGRRLTLERIGHGVALTLEDIEVLRRKSWHDVELVASDVAWSGVRITSASVHASNVSLELGATTTLTCGVVEIEGQTDLPAAIAWLSSVVGDQWLLDVSQAGLVEARRPGGAVVLVVEAQALDSEVNVELREIRWRRFHLVVPRWLRLQRSRRLPALPREVEVISAGLADGTVWFRLRVPRLREPFALEGIRKAILDGITRLSLPGPGHPPRRL
jgi:hypothetical protein